MVSYLIKGVALVLVGLLAFFCRTKPKIAAIRGCLGEVALVVLTMLFISERSWKHHFVTVLLPYTYLVCEFFSRTKLRSQAGDCRHGPAVILFMAATSTESAVFSPTGRGHEIAQGYGYFSGPASCSMRWLPGGSGRVARESTATLLPSGPELSPHVSSGRKARVGSDQIETALGQKELAQRPRMAELRKLLVLWPMPDC